MYRSWAVGIIFKTLYLTKILPILQQGVGNKFLVNLPVVFLKGKSNIIEVIEVAIVKKQNP